MVPKTLKTEIFKKVCTIFHFKVNILPLSDGLFRQSSNTLNTPL